MIEEHWRLERRAFANTPDPAFIYRSPSFEEGYARLLYDATDLRGGLSLITGEIGCGKTMLARAIAERLAGSSCDVMALAYPKVTPAQMLATVATGQPELRDRVRARPQIDQRVSLRFHIDPIDAEEVRPYVEHRLAAAGWKGAEIFTADAFTALAARSAGVPRRINTLATQALFVGAMRQLSRIDGELMFDVADDQE